MMNHNKKNSNKYFNLKKNNKIIGNIGESLVCNYLEKCQYKIICKNFYCYYGEIDIIFLDKNEIVFCEVKTRNNINYGFPAESVNYYKKKHIWNTAKYFLYINGWFNKYIRFDVIEVYLIENKTKINHIKNAFYL